MWTAGSVSRPSIKLANPLPHTVVFLNSIRCPSAVVSGCVSRHAWQISVVTPGRQIPHLVDITFYHYKSRVSKSHERVAEHLASSHEQQGTSSTQTLPIRRFDHVVTVAFAFDLGKAHHGSSDMSGGAEYFK